MVRCRWLRVTLACRSSQRRSIRFSFGQYGGRKCSREPGAELGQPRLRHLALVDDVVVEDHVDRLASRRSRSALAAGSRRSSSPCGRPRRRRAARAAARRRRPGSASRCCRASAPAAACPAASSPGRSWGSDGCRPRRRRPPRSSSLAEAASCFSAAIRRCRRRVRHGHATIGRGRPQRTPSLRAATSTRASSESPTPSDLFDHRPQDLERPGRTREAVLLGRSDEDAHARRRDVGVDLARAVLGPMVQQSRFSFAAANRATMRTAVDGSAAQFARRARCSSVPRLP